MTRGLADLLAPTTHANRSRVRALENGRWLLRAANDGVTGVVDHQGRLRSQLPQFTQGVLATEYQIMQAPRPTVHWAIGRCS